MMLIFLLVSPGRGSPSGLGWFPCSEFIAHICSVPCSLQCSPASFLLASFACEGEGPDSSGFFHVDAAEVAKASGRNGMKTLTPGVRGLALGGCTVEGLGQQRGWCGGSPKDPGV